MQHSEKVVWLDEFENICNKTGDIRKNVTSRRVRVIIIAVEK
jgi:hypothetical protein